MKHIRSMMRLVGLWLLISLLTACLARLQGTGTVGNQTEGDVQVLSPLTTALVALETPISDTYVLALTAYPTFPATPTPSSEEGKEGPTPTPMPTPSKIVNLAEGVSPLAIMVYIVQRADGSHEKWFIPDTMLPKDTTYPQIRDKILELGEQDRIIDAHPQELPPMMSGSPKPTPSQ